MRDTNTVAQPPPSVVPTNHRTDSHTWEVVGRTTIQLMNDVPLVRLTGGLEIAGATDAQSIRWYPATVDINGGVPALVADPVQEDLDGRSSDHGRRIDRSGNSPRARIPAGDLEDVLGHSVDDVRAADPVEVLLLASKADGQLALVATDSLYLAVDVQEWPDSDSE